MMGQNIYLQPASLSEALSALADTGGRLVAGGTDVMPALSGQIFKTPFIDLSRIAGLREIVIEENFVRIGGGATWTDILRAELPPCFDGLKAAGREVGSWQIQNVGTIAGNLCNASPAADGVPPLLTLDASVELTSQQGVRVVPVASFIQGNRKTDLRKGEILSAIRVPLRNREARSHFLKLGARRYLVISIVMVAALIERAEDGTIGEARVAVGACSAVAQRLMELEKALVGKPFHPATADHARGLHLARLSPIDDVRATAQYRLDAGAHMVRRVLSFCLSGGVHG